MVARKVNRGFTLIELLLVMVILAVLAVMVVPKFVGRQQDVKIKAAKSDISMISTALNSFEVDNGRFPTTEEGLQALVNQPSNMKDWKQVLDRVPMDPWGNPYVYISPGSHRKDYDIFSYGPDQREGGGDDIDNWTDTAAK